MGIPRFFFLKIFFSETEFVLKFLRGYEGALADWSLLFRNKAKLAIYTPVYIASITTIYDH